MFQPNRLRCVSLDTHVTPSGVPTVPLNSEGNRNTLAAAYAADGDPTMTPVMCGFWLQAIALDKSTKTFTEVQTVAHSLRAEYGMERHYAMAAATRVKFETLETFKRIAAGV